MSRTRRISLALLALGLLTVACGGDDDDAAPGSAVLPTAAALEGEVTVFAASSLSEAFLDLGSSFEEAHPRTKVTFNFAASSALAVQINEGAPADVFAAADGVQMKAVTDRGNARDPRVFARNQPVVVVPGGSSRVRTFADLANSGLKLVLAGPEVPIGRYARDILLKASVPQGGVAADFSERVLGNLKSNEANVRAVLTKVQLGEADAGIVYRTDVPAARGDVTVVEIPEAYNVVAEYPIAVISHARRPGLARAFVDFTLGPDGRAILEKYGFETP